jgi:hypothetical protein
VSFPQIPRDDELPSPSGPPYPPLPAVEPTAPYGEPGRAGRYYHAVELAPWWQTIPRWPFAVGGALVVLAGIWFVFLRQPPVREWPAPAPPVQKSLGGSMPLVDDLEGFRIVATDEYEVEAMVVSRKRYKLDNTSAISPVDWMLVWGELTEEPYVSGMTYEQSSRWGYWNWRGEGPMPHQGKYLLSLSANTHIVPQAGDTDLWKRCLKVRRGDVVRLRGYLMQAHRDGMPGWKSSRSRTDTANGACEIIYVTDLEVLR